MVESAVGRAQGQQAVHIRDLPNLVIPNGQESAVLLEREIRCPLLDGIQGAFAASAQKSHGPERGTILNREELAERRYRVPVDAEAKGR